MRAITACEKRRYGMNGGWSVRKPSPKTASFFVISTTGEAVYGRYKTLPVVDCRFPIENRKSQIENLFDRVSFDVLVRA
jgi:hypothetical protein